MDGPKNGDLSVPENGPFSKNKRILGSPANVIGSQET